MGLFHPSLFTPPPPSCHIQQWCCCNLPRLSWDYDLGWRGLLRNHPNVNLYAACFIALVICYIILFPLLGCFFFNNMGDIAVFFRSSSSFLFIHPSYSAVMFLLRLVLVFFQVRTYSNDTKEFDNITSTFHVVLVLVILWLPSPRSRTPFRSMSIRTPFSPGRAPTTMRIPTPTPGGRTKPTRPGRRPHNRQLRRRGRRIGHYHDIRRSPKMSNILRITMSPSPMFIRSTTSTTGMQCSKLEGNKWLFLGRYKHISYSTSDRFNQFTRFSRNNPMQWQQHGR